MSEPLDIGLDLDKIFLPQWAQQPPDAASRKYENFKGDDGRHSDRGAGPRGDRRGPPKPGGGFGGGGFGGGGGGGGFRGGPGGPAGPGGPRTDRRDRPPGGGPSTPGLTWEAGRPSNQGAGPRRDEPSENLPHVEVDIRPEPNGAASLARQIKLSGRAYPLFEVAGLVMQKPDRYDVTLKTVRGKDGLVVQPLFECSLDESVWLSEADAVKHVLKKHFDTFYQIDKQPCDPPKGVWTLVAQCGITGEVLGPPNFHGYQEKLRKIHQERFYRMPFEAYKAKVRFVKDEAVVKQWLESQSSKIEYTTLNVPEPKKLSSLDEVEAHFKEIHRSAVIRSVNSWTVKSGENRPSLPSPLLTLIRLSVDKEKRFPLRTATSLSGQFANAGLHFFKRDKVVVHVSVARPTYLDLEASPVKEGIKQIVDFIQAHPKCTRRQLTEALVPAPFAIPVPAVATGEPASPPDAGAPAAAEPPPPASPPATAPIHSVFGGDLHWLIHQGHVIEFANGVLECAKKPVQKPEPVAKQPKAAIPPGGEGVPKGFRRSIGLLLLPAPQPMLVGD